MRHEEDLRRAELNFSHLTAPPTFPPRLLCVPPYPAHLRPRTAAAGRSSRQDLRSTMHVLSLNLQRGGGINASAYGACVVKCVLVCWRDGVARWGERGSNGPSFVFS